MAKFSKATPRVRRGTAPVTTSLEATEPTFNGAAGFLRSPEGEAFLLASGGFLGGEKTFYEGGDERDDRFRFLIRELSVTNPVWVARFLSWLRREGNIRTAAIMGAAEYVWARRDEMGTGRTDTVHPAPAYSTRAVVRSVLLRADEPQEIIGYWMSRYGRNIPQPLKRGVADAAEDLYNQFSVLKHDSPKNGIRMGDVLGLVHAKCGSPEQDRVFNYVIADRFNRVDRLDYKNLQMISAHLDLMRIPVEQRRATVLANPEIMREAGMTWERLAGWIQGPLDAKMWELVIPQMGYMALLRNLRNFVRAGVSREILERVARRISDENEVKNSKQFPFRFWSAYLANASNVVWAYPLERALNYSVRNVPALNGSTLILVDRSGSMFGRMSEKSDVTWADAAAVFGSALALRADRADLVQFGDGHRRINFGKGDSILPMISQFHNMGGTNTIQAIQENLRSHHTRVIVITDEQTSPGYVNKGWYGREEISVNDLVPSNVPFYMWNFGGYRASAVRGAGSDNCYNFGGLTDSSFKLISLVEEGQDAGWPWEVSASRS